eukprot:EG_transcript_55824
MLPPNMMVGWPGAVPQHQLMLNMADGPQASPWPQVSPGAPAIEPPSLGSNNLHPGNSNSKGKQPRKAPAPAAPSPLLSPLQAQLQVQLQAQLQAGAQLDGLGGLPPLPQLGLGGHPALP